MKSIKLPTGTFTFTRLSDGQGFWICLEGKDPTSCGNASTRNQIVSVDFSKELTDLAIERGIGTVNDFVRCIEKPKYAPVHIPKEPKDNKGRIRFAINPFKLAKAAPTEAEVVAA